MIKYKNDLGRPSFHFRVGFSLAILQTHYFVHAHSSASFLMHVYKSCASFYQNNYSTKVCPPHQAAVLLEQGPSLIYLILVTPSLTFATQLMKKIYIHLLNELLCSLTVHFTICFSNTVLGKKLFSLCFSPHSLQFCSLGGTDRMIPN